ncbi:phytanoyl-CoA dioxygenase family protein [Paenibacillus sp. GCM10023250]|uniref:phytanoyl-CoA dioxygenase family protein n=1 Tax=Paenibacillus sp. GCM10023250 TaxID=3252648 RepID=UPI00361D6657
MKVTAEELAAGRLSPATLELAVRLIEVNGFVLFEGVLPRARMDALYARMEGLLQDFMEERGFSLRDGFHDGTNHIGLHLPFEQPFCDESLIAHPFVTDVVDRILGEDCLLTYFASNTSMPGGTKAQHVHADMGARFGDRCNANLPITHLVVNYPFVDVTEENGPMEAWPGGTHLHPDRWYGPNAHDKSRLAEHMLSFKATMPAGSILIRDDRMWHRGTPNRSDRPRTNMALIYTASANGPSEGSIAIPQETYVGLSGKAKRLLRKEKIGFPAARPR